MNRSAKVKSGRVDVEVGDSDVATWEEAAARLNLECEHLRYIGRNDTVLTRFSGRFCDLCLLLEEFHGEDTLESADDIARIVI